MNKDYTEKGFNRDLGEVFNNIFNDHIKEAGFSRLYRGSGENVDENSLKNSLFDSFNEQRQKDLKAISFHSGIPVDVLQGYLTAKPFDIKDIEVPESVAGD